MLKSTIISLGVFSDSGGPTKTINAFKGALEADLFSFCSPRELSKDRLAIEGAEGVVTSKLPLLEQIRYASPHSANKAEASFAKSSIVSCHSFYRYHALWVNQMSRKHGIPYWFVPHGILDPWVMEYGQRAKKLFWQFGGRRFLEEAATVIFSTSSERDKAVAQFELPQTDVIHWPVELVDISDRVNQRNQIRQDLAISEEAKVLLYFGRLHSMKKPLETIRAVADGGDENLHLMIIGNEQDVSLKECYEQACALGVEKRVHLVGPVYGDKKHDYLMAADAYISLSSRENFNHTAAESMSAGLPLILSPGNDLLADISNLKCSWGLNSLEPKAIADAVSLFSTCPKEQLAQMGARGRKWVSEKLQFCKFQERIINAATKYGMGVGRA